MALPLKSDFGSSIDLVDIQEIRGNIVILKNTSLKQIVMVGGVNFALKSETEQNVITQGYQNLLNGVDFPLQIVIHSRKVNIDIYIKGLLARKESEDSALLKNQIDEHVEFIKGFVQKNAIMEKTFLVVVPFYPTSIGNQKKAAAGFIPFFGKGAKSATATAQDDEETERLFKENSAQLNQRTQQVVGGLLNIGLEAEVLQDTSLTELFYNFYNPQTVEREGMMMPKE